MEDAILGHKDEFGKNQEAQFNIFRFQDHLNYWIGITAHNFYLKDYSSAFESLQNLYADINGFLQSTEQKEIDEAYRKCLKENNEYLSKISAWGSTGQNTRVNASSLYYAIVEFRFKLMKAMANHQMLMKTIRRSFGQATSEM